MNKIYCKNCEHLRCHDFSTGRYKCICETLHKKFDPIVGDVKTIERHVAFEELSNKKLSLISPFEYHKYLNEFNDCKHFKAKSYDSKLKSRPKIRTYNEGCLIVVLVPLTLIGVLIYKCIV